jgi:uncharacterized protein YjiS (DUF1127 family)
MHTIGTATSLSRTVKPASLTISARGAGRIVLNVARVVFDLTMTWRENARQRRHLLALSDDMLKDIGVSRADAEHEGSKPFWRT